MWLWHVTLGLTCDFGVGVDMWLWGWGWGDFGLGWLWGWGWHVTLGLGLTCDFGVGVDMWLWGGQTVSLGLTCALIRTSRQWAAYNYTSSLALWETLEYELVDANGGIQKLRVEPATRSAVATCYTPGRGKIVLRNVINVNN